MGLMALGRTHRTQTSVNRKQWLIQDVCVTQVRHTHTCFVIGEGAGDFLHHSILFLLFNNQGVYVDRVAQIIANDVLIMAF